MLELVAAAGERAIPTRANTNTWWGGRGPISIGEQQFADDQAVVAALRERQLGRLALSLDLRYEQYPELLDRLVRVASLCEEVSQDYEVVATEPDRALALLALERLQSTLGHPSHHLRFTPMETVDIGGAAVDGHHSRAQEPDAIGDLMHTAPCSTRALHRP